MVRLSCKSQPTIRIPFNTGMLCLALVSVFSTVSASPAPTPEASRTRLSVNLPRTYCSADVALLGTGLVSAPIETGPKNGTHKTVRWTGWVRAAAGGKYEFSLPNSGARVFLNQQQVFAQSGNKSKPTIIQIELLANRYYAIAVEAPDSKEPTLPLRWRRPDGRHETVPKAYLYAPLATTSGSEKI
jgi:PA14 domain